MRLTYRARRILLLIIAAGLALMVLGTDEPHARMLLTLLALLAVAHGIAQGHK